MRFEKKTAPLLSRKQFLIRQIRFFGLSSLLLLFSIMLGVVGYHYTANLSWMDSLLNASMILTGMGPVDRMNGNAAKLFSSFYALYSGIAFLSSAAVFFAPVVHRLMHMLNIEVEEE